MQESTRLFMYGKIHRCRVTEANLDYMGSITIDPLLLDATGILPYTQVDVVNITNGARLQTYVIPGNIGAGEICLNGAAAHLFSKNDLAIIMAYEQCPISQLVGRASKAVMVDHNNQIIEVITYQTPSLTQLANGEVPSRAHEPYGIKIK
ncbi:aspartate 1-decarboxylase [Entomomonas moraniae]|uniref:Aspartate 1-decarboxylase n=1 Tax=Entomomonas moraniae TaxID=2213226 RepID=A0A3Q9JLH7_9GAMM|nr:aspartate 1-decarboxylase [Entomomonas moraniae]AZS50896.1 aspartate 1-decarboxylase [Entomomonas moraniae]